MTTIEEPRLRPHSLAHVHWRTVRRYLAAEAVVLIGLPQWRRPKVAVAPSNT